MSNRLTLLICVAMVAGVLAGLGLHGAISDPDVLKTTADYFTIPTDIFLRLIRMIIAPLVLTTLVTGIANLGDTSALGRIGARTMAWFLGASVVSLSLGLVLANAFQPGATTHPISPGGHAQPVVKAAFDLHDFLIHIVPASVVEAMAANEILQIVVFAVVLGVALTAIGDAARPLVHVAEAIAAAMLKITDYVMRLAPLAVFAALAHAIAINGAGILFTFGRLIATFYTTLMVMWTLLIIAAFVMLGRKAQNLVLALRAPTLLAFSTASSESAYPRLLETLEAHGVPRRIASFVLPLGYSFNLDGSMIYVIFATLFIAQAYGMEIAVGQQILMALMLMITSKGIAGVPRASPVVVAAVMPHFGIPEAGLLLILAVEQFLDMGRSATNVLGNGIAAAVVAKWENRTTPQPITD